MVKNKCHPWARASRCLCLCGFLAGLAGCGARGFAPDSIVENPGASAFLSQVGKECGDMNMGTADINWLLQSEDDVYFVDETTKLYFGDVSKAQYADDLGAFYPVGDASRALPCIYRQLPANGHVGPQTPRNMKDTARETAEKGRSSDLEIRSRPLT